MKVMKELSPKQFRFSVVCGFEMTRERLYQLKTIETMKKCLYLLLILLLLPLAANADDSGSCGDNVTYVFEEATGTLTISGTGAMSDYDYYSSSPWNSYRKNIKTVVLNDGVTSIGGCAFYLCIGLTSIEIPNSVTSIGYCAFQSCNGLTSIVIPNSVTSIGEYAFAYCI